MQFCLGHTDRFLGCQNYSTTISRLFPKVCALTSDKELFASISPISFSSTIYIKKKIVMLVVDIRRVKKVENIFSIFAYVICQV